MQIRKFLVPLTFQKQSLRDLLEDGRLVSNVELVKCALGSIYLEPGIEAQNISIAHSMVGRDTILVQSFISGILLVAVAINDEEMGGFVVTHLRRSLGFMMGLAPITTK